MVPLNEPEGALHEDYTRVLVAEDDLTSRCMLAAILRKFGFVVIETADGDEAWRILQQPDAPLLVIVDWVMPHLDGLDLLVRLREVETDQPPYVIMLTSRSETKGMISVLEAGADDYLVKPVDAGELCARVAVGQRVVALQARLAGQIKTLRAAMEQVKTLHGILPICSFCKKIRNDQGYWDQVDAYISKHSDALFSHGICPECAIKQYPDEFGSGQAQGEP